MQFLFKSYNGKVVLPSGTKKNNFYLEHFNSLRGGERPAEIETEHLLAQVVKLRWSGGGTGNIGARGNTGGNTRRNTWGNTRRNTGVEHMGEHRGEGDRRGRKGRKSGGEV